jgi:hypothetical protein
MHLKTSRYGSENLSIQCEQRGAERFNYVNREILSFQVISGLQNLMPEV